MEELGGASCYKSKEKQDGCSDTFLLLHKESSEGT